MPPKRRRETSSGTPLPTTSTTSTTFSASIDTRTTPSSASIDTRTTPTAHYTTVTSPGSVSSASSVFIGVTCPALPLLPAPPALPALPPPPAPHPDVPSTSAGPSTRRRQSIRTSVTYLADSQGKAKKIRGFTSGASEMRVKQLGSTQFLGPMSVEVEWLKKDNARLTAELHELRTAMVDIRQRIAALEALVEKILNAPPHTCSQPPRHHHREDPPRPSATS